MFTIQCLIEVISVKGSGVLARKQLWYHFLMVHRESKDLSVYINLYLASPLSVGQETHPLCYLQAEVGCLTFLLARNTHPLCYLQAEVGCLTFLLARNTHPLCYLQAEVGCLTFLLARKHIPSATCRQKLAALPSYWPGTHIPSATCRQKLAALPSCWLGNTSPQLPVDISWLSCSAIHKAAGSLVTGHSQKYWRQE